ncbi:MAG: HlyD family secretion protein [bacterium]
MRVKRLRKRGNSFIKSREEVKRNPFQWGKYLYLAVLLLVALNILKWTYERFFFLKGEGYLEAEATFIEARTPGRIAAINCTINDDISAGDPLVVLSDSRFDYSMNSNGIGWNGSYHAHQRKIIAAEGKLSLIKQQINHRKNEINKLRIEYYKARELLALNAITRTQYLNLQDKLKAAEDDLTLLNIKFETALRTLKTFEESEPIRSHNANGKMTPVSATGYERILYAPIDGAVSIIYKQKGEIAQVGEPVLRIVNRNKSFIKAYFPGSYENSIHIGDEVKIYFENGEKATGVMRKIYPVAFTQPSEFKNKFGAVQRSIIAEIVPKEVQYWNRILETRVKVLVKKKWF